MSYKPQRSFMGSEGDYSVDYYGPEAIKTDIDNLMNMFDPTATHPDGTPGGIDYDNLAFKFSDKDMAEKLGAILDGNSLTVQKIIDLLYQMIKDRYTKIESDTILTNKTNPLIKTFNYDPTSGILDAITEGGETKRVFDLNIEKIPAAIGIVEEDGKIYIRVTNDDGTYTQSDVSELLTQFSFVSTDTITTNTYYWKDNPTHRSVSSYVNEASLELKHFAPGTLSSITDAKESASISAAAAHQSELNAMEYAERATIAADTAVSSEKGAKDSEMAAATSANIASNAADNANQFNESVKKNAKQVAEDRQLADTSANTASMKAAAAENALSDAMKAKEAANLSASDAAQSKIAAETARQDAIDAKKSADASATSALFSAVAAEESEDRAKAYKESAQKYSEVAKQGADNANNYANVSKSYAVGKTGTRQGEDEDNARYYAEQAKYNAVAGSLTCFVQEERPSINNCIWARVISEVSD